MSDQSPEIQHAREQLGKLDEHEKVLNALFMGLAGGLLAFAADYAKGFDSNTLPVDKVLAAVSIFAAAFSLAVGAIRARLRTKVYLGDAANVAAEIESQRSKAIAAGTKEARAQREAAAQKIVDDGGTKEDVLQYLKESPDPMVVSIEATAESAGFLVDAIAGLRADTLINRLEPIQIMSFLAGVITFALVVFRSILTF